MQPKKYADIERAREKAGEAYVAAGNLFSMWEKARRTYDECRELQRAGKLSAEDIGRCNFCAELLKKKGRFQIRR